MITFTFLRTCACAGLRRSDTGDYECWAASETGLTRSRKARISVDAPSSGAVVFHRSPEPNTFPASPGRPSVSDATNTSVRLAWRAPNNAGTSPLIGYVVEYFSHVIGQVPAAYLLTEKPVNFDGLSNCLCNKVDAESPTVHIYVSVRL